MKCGKCRCEIESVLVDRFSRDGSDSFEKTVFAECQEDAAYIDTDSNWTGYDLTDEERKETIRCPICGQFPFSDDDIQVYDVVRIVCFKQDATMACEMEEG